MRNKRFVLSLICLLSIAGYSFLTFSQCEYSWIEGLRLKSIDYRFQIRGPREPSGDVVNLVVDEKSLKAIGRWPWERSVFAHLILQLEQYGARTIAFDLLFTEPESNPAQKAINTLMHAYMNMGLLDKDPRKQAFMDEMEALAQQHDSDRLLAKALFVSDKVVLPLAFEYGQKTKLYDSGLEKAIYPSIKQPKKLAEKDLLSMPKALIPLESFITGVDNMGFVNFFPDKDGVIRRGHLALLYQDSAFMPFAMAIADTAITGSHPVLNGSGAIEMEKGRIPMNEQGEVFLDFYGPSHTFPAYSCVDVLNGNLPKKALQDKIVLIGGATTGLGDLWSTPLARKIWGVELQAAFAENILQQEFILTPAQNNWVTVGCITGLSIGTFLLLLFLPAIWSSLSCLGLYGFYLFVSQYLFILKSLLWPVVLPLTAAVTVWTVSLVANYFLEGRQKRYIKQVFSRYLSPDFVDILVTDPSKVDLGGEEQELTVLFTDIRNFSTISENLAPSRLISILNRHLECLSEVILNYGGTLDKYIGDAIMAFFGAPVAQSDHPLRACKAAMEMSEMLRKQNLKSKQQGELCMEIGIGINTGEMIVGNMGSSRRFDYSVIGNHVNIASRLEGLTKIYGIEIILSKATLKHVSDSIYYREIDTVKVKGVDTPITIFEPLGERRFSDANAYDFVPVYEKALQLYRQGDFEAADRLFAEVQRLKSTDGPAAVLRKRCASLMHKAPLEAWDGVWDTSEKK